MISHCTCYCWKAPGHLRDSAGVSAILFVCSFADPTLFPPFLQVLSLQFLSYVLHAFKQTCWCTIRYLCLIFTWLVYFRSFIFSFVGSDPDPSLFWCNNETAVSGQSLESCKNNPRRGISATAVTSGTVPHNCTYCPSNTRPSLSEKCGHFRWEQSTALMWWCALVHTWASSRSSTLYMRGGMGQAAGRWGEEGRV